MSKERSMMELAAMLAGMSQQFSQYSPGQKAFGEYLLSSAEGSVQKIAQKEAEEKAKREQRKRQLQSILSTGGLALLTGGAGLALAPVSSAVSSGLIGASGSMALGALGSGVGYATKSDMIGQLATLGLSAGLGGMMGVGARALGNAVNTMNTSPTDALVASSQVKAGAPTQGGVAGAIESNSPQSFTLKTPKDLFAMSEQDRRQYFLDAYNSGSTDVIKAQWAYVPSDLKTQFYQDPGFRNILLRDSFIKGALMGLIGTGLYGGY
jgi:hypothetical protein